MRTVQNNVNRNKTNETELPSRSIGEVIKSGLRNLFQILLNIVFTNDPRKIGQVMLNGRCQLVWPREHVGRKIVLRIFERRESRFFLHYLKQGDICLDIGANVGYYTNLFSSLIGKTGRVIAVEPLRRNVLLIQLASAVNGTEDIVRVICAAVSDVDSPLSVSQRGDSSYANIQTADQPEGNQVDGITGDTLLKRFGLSRIDVIKMDIEGWEFKALQGMRETLSNRAIRPRLMMIELYTDHLIKYGTSIQQICEYLGQVGYRPNVLNKQGNLIPYRPEHHNIIYNVFFLDANITA